MERIKKLIEDIIKSIVDSSDDVKIEEKIDEAGVLYRIWVDKKDMGMIIGRGGVTADALKLIVKLVGYKAKLSVSIKIEEPA